MSDAHTNSSSESGALVEARAKYGQSMREIREMLFRSPHMQKGARVRAQAEFYLEQVKAVAFNLGVAARQEYPRFLSDTLFGPTLYPIWGPNPDFLYAWTHLDGARNYRITGKRNDSAWGSFQLTREFWGDPQQKNLAELPFDDMKLAADGSYEILVSAEKHQGNWLPLDHDCRHNYIFLRRTIIDWERETPASAHIEMLGEPAQPYEFDECELAARIQRAGRMLRNATAMYTIGLAQRPANEVGANNFLCVSGNANQDDGYNPGAEYFYAAFELGESQALLIETESTGARYWGIHLTDTWLQTLNYVNQQSSLNASQACVDRDGKCRFVLSLQDPGVANWLDPGGNSCGLIQFRSYYARSRAQVTARIVPLSAVRSHLPADTPSITASERSAALRKRARSILRHYGA